MKMLNPPNSLSKASPAIRKLNLITVLIVIGLAIFFAMWLSVITQSFAYKLDQPLFRRLNQIEQNAPGWLNSGAHLFTTIGSQGLTVATVFLLAYFLFRRQFHRFWLMLTAVGGGELVWLALIFTSNRPRPIEIRAVTGLKLPSFPSGHVMIFIAFFGALIYMYLHSKRNRSRTWALIIATAILSLISGAIRLYFSAHFFTDVIAGYGIGIAWTAFSLTLVDWLWFKRKLKKNETAH